LGVNWNESSLKGFEESSKSEAQQGQI